MCMPDPQLNAMALVDAVDDFTERWLSERTGAPLPWKTPLTASIFLEPSRVDDLVQSFMIN